MIRLSFSIRKTTLPSPRDPDRLEVLEVRVRPVAGDALGVEDPDPEDEILDRRGGRRDVHLDDHALVRGEDVLLLALEVPEGHLADLDLALPPPVLPPLFAAASPTEAASSLFFSKAFSCFSATSWR